MPEEPAEQGRTSRLLKQFDKCSNFSLYLRCTYGYRKTCKYPLWGRLSLHLPTSLAVFHPSIHLLNTRSSHCVGIQEPLGTLAQEIDLLQAIVLNTPIWFPVALLLNDTSNALELLAHSSTPPYLQQQEDISEDEHHIGLVYVGSYGGQFPLDR